MSYAGEREHPRSQDIPLTAENEELREDIIIGLGQVLTGDGALTVEVTDDRDEKDFFRLPQAKYLSRVAFLRVNGVPASAPEDAVAAPYLLAIELSGHLLDEESATEKSAEEIEEVGFAWPDGLSMTLLTPENGNIENWMWTYQPGAGGIFDFTGSKSGFKKSETPSQDVIGTAYSIERGLNSGTGITDDGLDRVAPFRIMKTILNEGRTDADTAQALRSRSAENSNIKVLPFDSEAAIKAEPYLERILHGCLSGTDFRNMLAWQQYWVDRDLEAGYVYSRGDIVAKSNELTAEQRSVADHLLRRAAEAYESRDAESFNNASSIYDELVAGRS